jgi:hypothetical protein
VVIQNYLAPEPTDPKESGIVLYGVEISFLSLQIAEYDAQDLGGKVTVSSYYGASC